MLFLAACAGGEGSVDLAARLAGVEGTFVAEGASVELDYSAPGALAAILAEQDTQTTLRSLVDCLDDTTPSASRLNGQPVPLGVVCFEALSRLAYHEPTDVDGDIAPSWDGWISPDATPAQLRRAKAAWQIVLAEKTYILP
jgi:hypothetical protein